MKNSFFIVFAFFLFASFNTIGTLKGTWEYRGSVLNGKRDGAPKEYTLQRKYTSNTYDAYLLEKGEKPVKFEGGNYKLKSDTCLETQTFSSQPTRLLHVTVGYLYHLQHDTLVLRAKLPNGNIEEDYWKKIK